jgi:7-carboxy-7-deazaguanine synthase
MSYTVKELIHTLQGEGAYAGRAAVFCRFTGCNLWTGHEADRPFATCRFCDTDFVGTDGPGGGRFDSPLSLARAAEQAWLEGTGRPPVETGAPAARRLIVCTGGEPALQVDPPLIAALHGCGFEIAIETNGTLELPAGLDWICVSPKARAELRVTSGDELKLIHPQPGAEPSRYENLAFRHFYLQPMDGPEREVNTRAVVDYCLRHPRWRVSLQMHKILGIP